MKGECTVYWKDNKWGFNKWGLKKKGGMDYDNMIWALENALAALKRERDELNENK